MHYNCQTTILLIDNPLSSSAYHSSTSPSQQYSLLKNLVASINVVNDYIPVMKLCIIIHIELLRLVPAFSMFTAKSTSANESIVLLL